MGWRASGKAPAALAAGLVSAVVLAVPGTASALAIPEREVWLVRSDGGPEKRLTRDRVEDGDPTFLPDGDIAYLRTRRAGFRDSPRDVWRMDAGGRGKHRIVRTPVDRQFGLASGRIGNLAAATLDGKELLLASQSEADLVDQQLLAWELTSTGVARKRVLRSAAEWLLAPSGGRDVVVISTNRGAFRTTDGKTWRGIKAPTRSEIAVARDGSRIAFTRAGALWVADGNGRGARRIVPAGPGLSGIGSPVFTADGKGIVFSWNRCPNPSATLSLYRTTLDGRSTSRLTHRRGWQDSEASVSPDGRTIAFSRSRYPGEGAPPCERP